MWCSLTVATGYRRTLLDPDAPSLVHSRRLSSRSRIPRGTSPDAAERQGMAGEMAGEMAGDTHRMAGDTDLRWQGLRWQGLRWQGLRWQGLRWQGTQYLSRQLVGRAKAGTQHFYRKVPGPARALQRFCWTFSGTQIFSNRTVTNRTSRSQFWAKTLGNFGGHSIYRSNSSECIHSCLHKTCVPAVDRMQYLHRS
jgi:hypothetical protein